MMTAFSDALATARREIDTGYADLVQILDGVSRRDCIKGYAASKRRYLAEQAAMVAAAVVNVHDFATGDVLATLRGPRDETVRAAAHVAISSKADVCLTVNGKHAHWSRYWHGFQAGDEAQYAPAWACS